ncbi:FAD-dependent oxidoreductase [Alteromonas sp. 5E99-2]|uniref:flavin monoamine oxidase family protein n=1 Tax=Alteromonas sp. 5E99-2 TaxID=2817683 RepID=UPI001F607D3A|nr:FAD-dependent oxidoreductase [Alteromonas sp. 5E99-2]
MLAAAGGSSLVYNASLAMDFMSKDAKLTSLNLPPANDKNKSIVILGAGIAGLATAYELEKAGYNCTIIEASHRAGGRNLTLRHGDLVDELGNPSICNFDDNHELYMNCGPARLPGHHQRILHYCKALKVPLRIFANSNRLAYLHDSKNFGGKPVRIGEHMADGRGFVAELAHKSLTTGQLDAGLTEEDIAKFKQFIAAFGDLKESGLYEGTERAGSTVDRMLFHAKPKAPKSLTELINSPLFSRLQFMSEAYDWGEPLMTPEGGMDKIVDGFMGALKSPVILNAQVKSIYQGDNEVEVSYVKDGKVVKHKANYCFNNIPAHFMSGIYNNLSENYRTALGALKRGKLFKIGFQMKERFWEDEGIYGGISYTDLPVTQIWYPSNDIFGEKGIMLGAYVWGNEQNEYFERMTPKQRLIVAAENGEKIHPGYAKYIETGVSIPWSRMNHMMGCGSRMSEDDHKKYFSLLQQPDGRHFMIGDQISYHPGWQEGALASAENALSIFSQQVGK